MPLGHSLKINYETSLRLAIRIHIEREAARLNIPISREEIDTLTDKRLEELVDNETKDKKIDWLQRIRDIYEERSMWRGLRNFRI